MAQCWLDDLLVQEDRVFLGGGRHAKQLEGLSIHRLHILTKCLLLNACTTMMRSYLRAQPAPRLHCRGRNAKFCFMKFVVLPTLDPGTPHNQAPGLQRPRVQPDTQMGAYDV